MSDRSKKDPEELLRKAREYVEKHDRESKRGDSRSHRDRDRDSSRTKKDKKRKHSRNHEEERLRRGKDRDHQSDDFEDAGKDSKRRKHDKKDRKRSKSGRHRQASGDLDVSRHGRPTENQDEQSDTRESHKKGKEASKKKSKDKKRSRDNKVEDVSSKKSRRRDDDSSSNGDNKKDSKRQKRPKKDKDEQKMKKQKKKDKKRQESKSVNSTRKNPDEINKMSAILGSITKKEPKKKINSDDYFAYHNHLRLFLYHKDSIYFEDLSSTETHKTFKKFCDKYNSGELEQAYYSQTLPEEAMEPCKRTKHRWNFNTNTTEQKSLDLIKTGVKKLTEYEKKNPFPSQGSAMRCIPTSTQAFQGRNNASIRERPKIPERKNEPIVKPNTNNGAKEKQEAMLKMLGLKAGQKITIAPRK